MYIKNIGIIAIMMMIPAMLLASEAEIGLCDIASISPLLHRGAGQSSGGPSQAPMSQDGIESEDGYKMEKGQLVRGTSQGRSRNTMTQEQRRILLEELRRSEAARGQLAGGMDGKQSQQCPLENSSDLFKVKDSVKCTLEEDDRSQRSGLSLRSSVYQQALDAARREAEGYKERLSEADSVKRFMEKLERDEQLLAEKNLEIRDLIGKIAEKDAVIKEREQALIKLINEHQKALGAKDLAISNYRQLLDAKDAEIGAAKDGLAAKDVEIAASKAEISANKTEIGKRDAEIVRLNGLIANHGPALAVKDGEMRNALAAKDIEIQGLKGQLVNRPTQQQFDSVITQLAAKDREIEALRGQVITGDLALKQSQTKLAETKSEMDRTIKERSSSIDELLKTAMARGFMVRAYQKILTKETVEDTKKRVQEELNRAKIAHQDGKLIDLKKELDSIPAIDWKMFAPRE